jgi:hypothetical protein
MRLKPEAVEKLFAGVIAPVVADGKADACNKSPDQSDAAAPGCVVAPTEMT